MKFIINCLALVLLSVNLSYAQADITSEAPKKHFMSSSLFMLVNLFPGEDPPQFFQLNYGYRFTPKDALIIEAITWQYFHPLGIPYGPEFSNPEYFFPGIVKDYGIGVAYQRFHWKKLYTTIHATPFLQQYLTEEKEVIQTGFQLFLTARAGYQFTFWDNRIFLEPSVAFTSWPINTNMPDEFAREENKWPGYFLFEPGLHIGFNF